LGFSAKKGNMALTMFPFFIFDKNYLTVQSSPNTLNKVLLVCLLCLLSVAESFAQEVQKEVNVRANLESVLQLNIDPDAKVEFGIKEINDNLFMVTQYPEPVMFSVESTNNWNLSISTNSKYFSGTADSSLKMPVGFIGYTIESYGTNWDNGDYSNIINFTKDTLVPLSTERTLVLKNGRRNNMGGINQNFFIIKWRFLDEQTAMNIKKQSNFDLTDDNFKVGLKLTLIENLTIDSPK
jgi:hypothetical protein